MSWRLWEFIGLSPVFSRDYHIFYLVTTLSNVLEEILPQATVSEDSYKPSKTADEPLSLTTLPEEDSPDAFTPQDQVVSESAGPEIEGNQEDPESAEFGNEILAGSENEEEQETEQESLLQPSQNSYSPPPDISLRSGARGAVFS